jgi:hypothetical protein
MKPETKICAVFLFNNRFEGNLPILDRIYADRFTRRHVIMPFARSPERGISRVYELGRNFSGHLAQAARDFVAPDITHYVVIPDDLLLNPRLNETNLLDELRLEPNQGYIKNLISADNVRHNWPWAGEASASFRRFAKALDLQSELPAVGDARAKFEAMGLKFELDSARGLISKLQSHYFLMRSSGWTYLTGLTMRGQPSDYPLLAGYSDFLVIPACAIEQFVHYCGVLAALNIFAEVAVPTALALACDSVKTELALNHHFIEADAPRADRDALKGIEFWTPEHYLPHADIFDRTLDEVISHFPRDWLYAHPVKLSRYYLPPAGSLM